jgi:hypothetical protein
VVRIRSSSPKPPLAMRPTPCSVSSRRPSSEVSQTHAHVFGEQIDIQPFVAEIVRNPVVEVLYISRLTAPPALLTI